MMSKVADSEEQSTVPAQAVESGGKAAKTGKKPPHGKRRRAREMAVQMLYQQELGGCPVEQVFATFNLEDYLSETDASTLEKLEPLEQRRRAFESFDHARKLVRGTLEEGQALDDLIREHAENWRLERMPPIDRNILRLALYEMLNEKEVPRVVIVDEAIELAKRFGSENSGRFVNGLLDGVLKSRALERKGLPRGAAPSKA
jgi:transcription antitermination protein NusB